MLNGNTQFIVVLRPTSTGFHDIPSSQKARQPEFLCQLLVAVKSVKGERAQRRCVKETQIHRGMLM
jgi:hypothetical protein